MKEKIGEMKLKCEVEKATIREYFKARIVTLKKEADWVVEVSDNDRLNELMKKSVGGGL